MFLLCICIVSTDDEELEGLKKDMIDGRKLKLRKSNMEKEGIKRISRSERGHGMVMDDKPEFVHSMPLAKQLLATTTDDNIGATNNPVEKFSKSCIVQADTPPEFALIERHNIVSVAG